jgi:hypothetical protein
VLVRWPSTAHCATGSFSFSSFLSAICSLGITRLCCCAVYSSVPCVYLVLIARSSAPAPQPTYTYNARCPVRLLQCAAMQREPGTSTTSAARRHLASRRISQSHHTVQESPGGQPRPSARRASSSVLCLSPVCSALAASPTRPAPRPQSLSAVHVRRRSRLNNLAPHSRSLL